MRARKTHPAPEPRPPSGDSRPSSCQPRPPVCAPAQRALGARNPGRARGARVRERARDAGNLARPQVTSGVTG